MKSALLGLFAACAFAQTQDVLLRASNTFFVPLTADEPTASTAFAVDPADKVFIAIAASSAITVALVDPAGASHPAGSTDTIVTGSVANRVTSGGTSIANFEFELTQPPAGMWRLAVQNASSPPGNVLVIFRMNSTSELSAGLLGADGEYPVGRAFSLSFLLVDGGGGLPPGTVTSVDADMTLSQDLSIPLSFHDDGLGEDLKASDGIYTATTEVAAPGTYTVFVTAKGSWKGQPFTRTAAGAFTAVKPCINLDSPFRSDFQAGAGLTLTFAGRANESANVRASAELTSANGNQVTASSFTDVQPGTNSLTVFFPMEALESLQANGPYQVSRVTLGCVDPETLHAATSDEKLNLGLTEAVNTGPTGPNLSASPGQLDFGAVNVGQVRDLAVNLSNTGTAAVTINSLAASGPFAVVAPSTPFTLDKGQQADVTVRFLPISTSSASGTMTILSTDAVNPSIGVALRGNSSSGCAFTLSPTFWDYNELPHEGTIEVTASAQTCSWTAFSNVSWISVTGTSAGPAANGVGSGTGNGQVKYLVQATAFVDGARRGTMTVAGLEFVINQGSRLQTGIAVIRLQGSPEFGSVAVGSSATQPINISNRGEGPLTVTSIVSSNPMFTVSPAGPLSIAPGGTPPTVVTVRFAPTAAGVQVGFLAFNSTDPAEPRVVLPLYGIGTAGSGPRLSAAPTSINFDSVQIGAFATVPLTLINSGNAALTITSITSSNSRFTVTFAGPLTLPAATLTNVVVRFSPTEAGAQLGTLTIASNDPVQPSLQVPVSGNVGSGGPTAPRISVSPASLSFGTVATGTSAQLSITIANNGNAALSVSAITSSNAVYAVTPAAPFDIQAGGSSQVSVRFSPTSAGAQSGTLTIASNDPVQPSLQVSVSGTGGAPGPRISVSPVSLSFGTVATGTSAQLSITIANNGNAALSVSALNSSNPAFTVTPAAPLNIQAGGSTQVSVRFSATSAGAQSGTLTITSNDPAQLSIQVSLSGSGGSVTAGGPEAYWKFDEGSGTVASDSSGNGNTGTLLNGAGWSSGVRGTALNLDGVDDYVNAGTTLNVGSTFTVEAWIKGDPSTMEGWARIVDTGFATGFALGRFGGSQQVSFEFRGSAVLASTALVIDNAWHHIVVVKSGATATMYADGTFQGSVPVNAGGPVSTLPLFIGYNPGEGIQGHWRGQIDEVHIYSRALTATEILANYDASKPIGGNAPKIGVTPTSLSFGTVTVGSSPSVALTISNTGNAALGVTALTSSNALFTITPAAPLSIAAGASTQITVRFSPTAAGAQSGSLTIANNDPTQPSVQVALSGTGAVAAAPKIGVTPTSLNFGTVTVGSPANLAVTISNTGNAALSVTALTTSNALFTISPAAPLSIAAGGSTQITVRFSPTAAGAQSGTLTIANNDPAQLSVPVTLSGTGGAPSGGTGEAYWRFDEGSGTVASDSTGNGNAGNLLNGAAWTSGVRGTALNLDGADDYVNAGTTLTVGSTFTVEAWIKGDPTMEEYGRIVDSGYATGFALGRYGTGRQVGFEFRGSPFLVSTEIIDRTWRHVVVVKAGATATMYVDGVSQATVAVNAGAPVSTLPLFIGYNPGEGVRGHWKGQIDELRIYNRALTATEIQTNYNALKPSGPPGMGTSTPNAQAYWRFDEGSGTAANDATGHGNSGTLLNGAGWTTGVRGTAVNLDGVDDYVSVANTFKVTSSDFTLDAWVKGDVSMEGFGRILDSGYLTGFALGRYGGGRQVLFEFRGSQQLVSTAEIIDNSWHHVAVVKSGGTATLYTDGVAQGSVPVNSAAPTNTLPLFIGYNPGEGTRGHWKGQLDEIHIYDRALSAAEVQANYNARGQ